MRGRNMYNTLVLMYVRTCVLVFMNVKKGKTKSRLHASLSSCSPSLFPSLSCANSLVLKNIILNLSKCFSKAHVTPVFASLGLGVIR